MDKTALITDVQRFSLHDGPGIRTTVFFKGCNLRCGWCHNPETWSPSQELFYERTRCIRCGSCIAVCPAGALKIEDDSIAVDRPLCWGCGRCVDACHHDAMRAMGQRYEADALTDLLLRDQALFGQTGGITFSGGEPLLQAEFVREVGDRLAAQGIRIAVDTAGCVPQSALDLVLPVTDLFLYDVKIMDDALHVRHTGQHNAPILKNLRHLDALGKDLWIRRPLIRGINDTPEETEAFHDLLCDLGCVQQVDLLIYHDYGNSKSCALGLTPLSYVVPDREQVTRIAKMIESLRIRANVRW